MNVFRKVVRERDAHESSSCMAFIEHLKSFAGTQIKNVGSIDCKGHIRLPAGFRKLHLTRGAH